MELYLMVLKNFKNFKGRARRKEFWMFVLFNLIFASIFAILDYSLGFWEQEIIISPFSDIYFIIILIPSISVSLRRLHDIGRSGWNLFLGLIPILGAILLIIAFAQESNEEENKYGPNPKSEPNL